MGISVAIIDNQHFFAEGIRAIIRVLIPDVIFVDVANEQTPTQQKSLSSIDLLIFDPATLEIDVSHFLTKIRTVNSPVAVFVVASVFDITVASVCLQHGVKAFLLKSDPIEELQIALKKVLAGTVYYCHQIQEYQIGTLNTHVAAGFQLTYREREVLRLLLQDLSPKEIASNLQVSRKTVDAHKRNIFQKLGIGSMNQLVLYGIRSGLMRI